MKKLKVMVPACLLVAAGAVAFAQGFRMLKALLTGFQEVPVVSTTAAGEFQAKISEDETEIQYELTYSDLEGDSQQAHIHVGQPGVNGGISVWLCSNLASPPTPAGTQACPTRGGTITGTITAANVVGPTGQGVAPGEFAELVRAIRAGATYVNVHSTKFPGGEIRSQIDAGNHGKGKGKSGAADHSQH